MPLYCEWNLNPNCIAAVWHITESEDFFVQNLLVSGSHIKHAKRRIEFLAGRFLLQFLHKDFPLTSIIKDKQDKPQLPDQSVHFSISHSFPYVACIIDTQHPVGIDLQCWHKSIGAIQQKFLSEQEQQFCAHDKRLITLAWTAKEAAYKYQGLRGVDFIDHLPIVDWQSNSENFNIKIKLNLIKPAEIICLKGYIFQHFALSLAKK